MTSFPPKSIRRGKASGADSSECQRLNGVYSPLTCVARTHVSLVDVLTRAIWGAAWWENIRGKEAVAALILNRAYYVADRHPSAMPYCTVVVCRALLYQVQAMPHHWSPSTDRKIFGTDESTSLATCRRIARRLLAGRLPDMTGGARHYHMSVTHPLWAWARVPSAEIGDVLFYNF